MFRVTEAIRGFRPARGVSQWVARGVEERNYTKFLAFKGQLQLEKGMRGEQDKKTALSTAWRHRSALMALVAGRCRVTGSVHFPPSRLSYDQGRPLRMVGTHTDTTAAKLAEAERRHAAAGVAVWLAGLNPGVLEVVRSSGLERQFGRERLLFNARAAIARS